jgi:hypothetical protein
MKFDTGLARTTTSMRWLLTVAGTLVLIIGLPLYLVPQNSEKYFSWSVTSLSATFLGGAYLSAAVIEFVAARKRTWANARIAIPAVLVFTSLTLLVTVNNADRYHFNAPGLVQSTGTWAWLVVYVVVPPLMIVVLVVQLFRHGGDPAREHPIPKSVRVALLLVGMALIVGGTILLIDPGAASWMWPWPLTSLTSQAFGAWMVGFGIAMVHMAWEADWRRARPATAGAGTLGVLQLLAVLRHLGDTAWNSPQIWVYVAVLTSFVVLGVYGWRVVENDTAPSVVEPDL